MNSAVQVLLDDLHASDPAYQQVGNVSQAVSAQIQSVLVDVPPCRRRHWWSSERNHQNIRGVGDHVGSYWPGEPGVSNYICLDCGQIWCSCSDVRELR